MRQSLELSPGEHRILSAAAEAVGLSLDAFLIYGSLCTVANRLKGSDALRAHLMASERSGPSAPFDFNKMMASVEREYDEKTRQSGKKPSTTD